MTSDLQCFARKVGAAAGAAWWTVLLGAGVLTVTWLAWLGIRSVGAELGLAGIWGLEPALVFRVWFWFMAVLKLIVIVIILLAAFLSLWYRALQRLALADQPAPGGKADGRA